VARLAPGVTLEQARADVTAIMTALEREYPDTNTRMGAGVGLLHDWFVGDHRRALLLLMAAVGGVLLIACANVAGLLLARAATRRRELAIRAALGAGTLRLFRQLLIESGLLAIAAAVLGAGVAAVAIAWLRANGPADVPRASGMALDPFVLGFLIVTSIATAVIFGVVPAWHSVRRPASGALKDGGRSATAAGTRLRRLLIGAEVALAVVLLVGAGLIARSFVHLRGVDPGIDVSQAVSFKVTLPGVRYGSPEKIAAFYATALEQLRQTSGVRAAGATARLALDGYVWTSDLHIEGRPAVAGRELRHKTVTTGFFEAAGIRVLSGRDFTSADRVGAVPVVLVNETLARTYFSGGDALGQRVTFREPGPSTLWRTIVGVVADEKQDGLAATVMPEVYEAHAQDPRASMAVVVRATGDPMALMPAIRQTVADLDDKLALYDIRTLEQLVDRSLTVERFATMVLTSFAGGALLLAAIGLYGVIAFTVMTRTREIGVRLALGASRAAVLRMVVWDGLSVVLAGLVVGLPLALLLARGVRAFLFQTPPADPVVLAGVGIVLLLAGTLASYLPALRASRVDPAISLRTD
jgi:predicted permease